MKKIAPLCMAFALAAAGPAQAQLTMQMSNGWSFTFAGNVNAFFTYEKPSKNTNTIAPGGIVGPQGPNTNGATRLRTGLLPAFAVFDAKGKEGNTDVGVHFGFAPQINCAAGVHDCFGAQIDMRQVYLTVGGAWGQLLAGRELGLFGRQNILTDQTLFGVGATGGSDPGTGAGTTLGRIGFGYIYPQFKAQMTYSTPAGRPGQLSIGLFEGAGNGPYVRNEVPRVEAEGTYNIGKSMIWLGGLLQNSKTPFSPGVTASTSATAWGGHGGFKLAASGFGLVGSGYYGKGLGTTLLFNGTVATGALGGTDGTTNGSNSLRKSFGFIGQLTYTPANSKLTVAGSYGSSYLAASTNEKAVAGGDFRTENTLISGGIYYQATKSLKVVGEGNYAWTKLGKVPVIPTKNKTFVPAFGFMLFF
jgi:hypothetical protein